MLYAFDCLSMNSWSWFATTNVCLIVALQWIATAFQMSDFVLSKRGRNAGCVVSNVCQFEDPTYVVQTFLNPNPSDARLID